MGCASSSASTEVLRQGKPAAKNGYDATPPKPSHVPPEVTISDTDVKDSHALSSPTEGSFAVINSDAIREYALDNDKNSDNLDGETEEKVSPPLPNINTTGAPRPAVVIPKQAIKTDVEQHLSEFKKQQEINDDKLNQQQMMSKLRLEEKLRRRKQKKLGNDGGVVIIEPEVPAQVNVKAGKDFFTDAKIDEAPKPIAPITSKDVLYSDDNIALFTDLEKYAVSLETSHVTFETLMSNLFISDLSDLEKVRILFHWITAQNLNTIEFPPSLPEDSPMAYLKAVKDDIKSYASLFQRLCHAAGLHAKLVQGYLKGVGYTPDYKFSGSSDPLRGTWNAVLIDRQWRLIDTHWGARHVNEENGMARETWQTEYRYEEHYFLTDPDKLISTHFPDDKEWQLLSNSINLEQFQEKIKQWPLFYKLKLTQNSHQRGLINADEHGYIKIRLGVSAFARSDAKFRGELRHRENVTNSTDLQQYVLHYATEKEEIFEIFLPNPGKFLFKIFGLSSNLSEDELFTNICIYQIECPKIKSPPKTNYLPPFPVVNFCYGPSKMMHDFELEAVSHLGPVVECDKNGEAKIVLSAPKTKSNLTFTQDLTQNQTSVPNSALHCLVPDKSSPNSNLLIFHIRVPKEGTYSMTLFAGNKLDSSQGLTAFCHYLVTLKQQSPTSGKQFPAVPNGALGKLEPEFSNLDLEVVSCSGGDEICWLEFNDKGEAYFSFSHKQPVIIIANLLSSTETYDDFTTVITDGEFSTVLVRSPPLASNSEILLLKLYAAPVTQAVGLPCVFAAFVEVKTTIKTTQALPQSPNRIWGPFGERYYSCGIKNVKFTNSVPSIASSSPRTFPFRCYKGGDNFQITLQHSGPLHLKPKLLKVDNGASVEHEGFSFVSKSSSTDSTVVARFSETGMYSLSLYGECFGSSAGQLAPLHNTLIYTETKSQINSPFPNALNMWAMSFVHLQEPLLREIKRKVPTNIKLSLGSYEHSGSDVKVIPYHRVLLLIDDSTPQEATTDGNCEYEWSYIGGPGEKKVGVIIQPDANNQSMNYALQFSVVD